MRDYNRPDLNHLNQGTQPLDRLDVFGNWDAVPLGWYALCDSKEVKKNKIKTYKIMGQQVVVWRDETGATHALDAFCPHMGLNLAQGEVEGRQVRCKFHGWRFNEKGSCTHIPCAESPKKSSKTQSYATEEQYGLIWIYPDEVAPKPVFIPHDLRGKELDWWHMKPLKRKCHPHAPMINGIDAQHVKAVHDINIVPEGSIRMRDEETLEIYLGSKIPEGTTTIGRLARWILGPFYAYINSFVDGNIALLNTVKDVKLFGKWKAPECNIVYSIRYFERGESSILPICVTEKRRGFLARLRTKFVLLLTKIGFEVLKNDEGDEFFEDLRFRHDNLLEEFDKPIKTLIDFLNSKPLSKWSTTQRKVIINQEKQSKSSYNQPMDC